MSVRKSTRALLVATSAAAALMIFAQPGQARAQDAVYNFDIPSQDVSSALIAYGRASRQQLVFDGRTVSNKRSAPLVGDYSAEDGLSRLLEGTGLRAEFVDNGAVRIVSENAGPQSGSAAGGGAEVEALIVTAQKREEDIQDVPIAISAFTQEALEAQKIEGGFDLLKAIPNVTFSKNNFTSYNFSIRGVGTKAVSATTDPGVAVAFNNSTIIQNRLFEQEYLDMERVEVLRGPQGTLYGRNATSGVINVISAKPKLGEFSGELKGEVGNYHTKRLRAMVNVPIVQDVLGVRIAGALTDRAGYDQNLLTGNAVNGRDLWTTRVTVGFEPNERLRANFIWERFEENDNRSRTGKQLCHRDDGPAAVGDTVLDADDFPSWIASSQEMLQGLFSQGCKPGSLYDDGAFGTPNGRAVNFVNAILTLRRNPIDIVSSAVGVAPGTSVGVGGEAIIQDVDPYGGLMQSRDLRAIESIRDPVYHATADLLELNADFDLTPDLTLTSQTTYVEDSTYSFQDFNRFATVPSFTDTSTLDPAFGHDYSALAPGGEFCDPQIGCSDRVAGFDIAQAKATQWNQEFRLQSSFDGPVNFSVGANYTKFDVLVDYYIFFNVLTSLAWTLPLNNPGGPFMGGTWSPSICDASNFWMNFPVAPTPLPPGYPLPPTSSPAVPTSDPNSPCPYVDPNPLKVGENFQGDGHNYFRSKNPYTLESRAGFGEVYWNIRDDLKLTAGLRYTDDEKMFRVVPSQLLLSPSFLAGGTVPAGYPEDAPIKQNWGEWTGRLVLDWKPQLDFTDETLLYASYSHGYKGGGANPPTPGYATKEELAAILLDQGYGQGHLDTYGSDNPDGVNSINVYPVLALTGNEYGETFDPEFVDAYEIGAKNTLLDGAMTLNATAFFYDYKDYQVSQIRDRTAVNENFDAKTWGVEFETFIALSENLQVIGNFGYLNTRIADGETSIDIMNRTQGDPNYVVVKPWVQLPSNCVAPTPVVEWVLNNSSWFSQKYALCGVGGLLGFMNSTIPVIDPNPAINGGTEPYDVNNYPELNGGAGILADLGGNQLPNAPHWTANVGAQYGWDFLEGWRATVRGDVYWQSQSYHRVYNYEPYDKLRGWYNVNLSVWIERPDDGLKIELYAKNLFDDTPITDAFLNSDDTGLTTNVFTLDPRLIGLSIRKGF